MRRHFAVFRKAAAADRRKIEPEPGVRFRARLDNEKPAGRLSIRVAERESFLAQQIECRTTVVRPAQRCNDSRDRGKPPRSKVAAARVGASDVDEADLRPILVGGKVAMPADCFRPVEGSRSARTRRGRADNGLSGITVLRYVNLTQRATDLKYESGGLF